MKNTRLDEVKIRKAMKRLGYSVADIAVIWDITRQGVEYALHNGSPYHAVKFGELLGISPGKLIIIE